MSTNMNLTLNSQNYDIVQNMNQLTITGSNNKIKIKSHINQLKIIGNNNKIDGLYTKCLVGYIQVVGDSNILNFNNNCTNASSSLSGTGNQIKLGNGISINVRVDYGNNNYSGTNINTTNTNTPVTREQWNKGVKGFDTLLERYNVDTKIRNDFIDTFNKFFNTYQNAINTKNNVNLNINQNTNNVVNQNVNQISNQNSNRYAIPSVNQNSNRYINPNLNQNSNRYINPNLNQNINSRVNNSNQNTNSNVAQNSIYNSNVLFNDKNLSDFDKKKDELFLEMDQFQYKHIQKYDSRRETECAICLEEFKRNDIIKEFYKCKHIFHKECLKNWLKRSNICPLCKHDLTEDIKKMR